MRYNPQEHNKRRLFRPTFYRLLTRFLAATAIALLWNRFVVVNSITTPIGMGHVFCALGFLFLGFAWFNYLSLDGVRLPKMPTLPQGRHKKAANAFRDMSDHIDSPHTVADEQLTERDKTICNLVANVVCGGTLLLIMFF